MKKIFLLVTLFLVSISAQAATVNLEESQFEWKATKITGGHNGKIFLKEASIKKENEKIQRAEFVMDMKNFTVEDLNGEKAQKFLNHVKSEDFFEVNQYPTAKLVINSIENNTAKGQLTIKNKTEDVSIPFNQKGNVYEGTLVFNRTKFGITYNSGNFFKDLGDKLINDDVTLNFKVKVD